MIARDPAFDATLALVRDGYEFIWNRCRRLDTDAFRTRIMLKPAVCIHGPDAARLFYDESKMERHGALPRRVVTSLFGKRAVHTLDGAAHRARKSAFLALMAPERLETLMRHTTDAWRAAIRRWEGASSVVLFDEAQRILTSATCAWAGVPLGAADVPRRARDFGRMVDAFGGAGPRLWKGKLARARTERWLERVVRHVRDGAIPAPADSALHVMAHHRDADGRPLDARLAAVELINVIRPTVAVSWFIAFAALAMHDHPEMRDRLVREQVGNGHAYADAFMQEVRRFYPFTPFVGARVRRAFEWNGERFEPGTLMLLDVYGMNHDPRLWERPDAFRPERFVGWTDDGYTFIPQGGGDRETGHRCPGEWIVMHNVTLALHFLARCITWDVMPAQNLSYSLRRMPTGPRSGFVVRRVRRTPAFDGAVPALPSATAARDAAAERSAAVRAAAYGIR